MAQALDETTVRALLPARPETGHKGTFGHVGIIAASRGFTGAGKLAGLGAARSGAGLVTVAIPRPLADVVAAGLLEVMTFPLPATDAESMAFAGLDQALAFAESKDAIALGPGLGQHEDTARFVLEFVRRCPLPLVVDADGLNNLARDRSVLDERPTDTLLTPHPGEMGRLIGKSPKDVAADRETVAVSFAEEHRCVVALKGFRTVIAHPDGRCFENPTGNNGLGTGGTGDVLTGLLGGLLAQGCDAFSAALMGAYVHGLAGDMAAAAKTERGLIASDVIDALPEAWRRIEGTP